MSELVQKTESHELSDALEKLFQLTTVRVNV
jgi:hypothetical protein